MVKRGSHKLSCLVKTHILGTALHPEYRHVPTNLAMCPSIHISDVSSRTNVEAIIKPDCLMANDNSVLFIGL